MRSGLREPFPVLSRYMSMRARYRCFLVIPAKHSRVGVKRGGSCRSRAIIYKGCANMAPDGYPGDGRGNIRKGVGHGAVIKRLLQIPQLSLRPQPCSKSAFHSLKTDLHPRPYLNAGDAGPPAAARAEEMGKYKKGFQGYRGWLEWYERELQPQPPWLRRVPHGAPQLLRV